jgi:hypothetical protein
MRRIWMGAAVTAMLAVPASLVLVGLDGGQAFAKGPHGKITCAQMSGSISSGFITISQCSGTATPGTGGSSQPVSIALLANGGTVTWTNGQTTVFGKPAENTGLKPKHCTGYVKPTKTNPTPAEPTIVGFSGTVNGDTTGMKVPGKYKGEVCISQAGNFSAPKALKVN